MYYYTRLVPFLSMPDLPANKAFFCIFFVFLMVSIVTFFGLWWERARNWEDHCEDSFPFWVEMRTIGRKWARFYVSLIISTLKDSISKVSFFWNHNQDMSSSGFPPKKDPFTYLVYQLEACFLAGNTLNSCSDSDLRKNWL